MAYNTVTVTTSATLIVAANVQRVGLFISNTSTTVKLYIGPDTSITTSNGIEIPAGGNLTEDSSGTSMYKGPIYGIAASSIDVRYWERQDAR